MYEYIEKIQQYAKDRSMLLHENYSEAKLASAGTSKTQYTEKQLHIKINRHGCVFYLCFYDSLGPSTGNDSLYCALQTVSRKKLEKTIIQKRDWFDALSLKKRFKTDNAYIDKKCTIRTESKPSVPITHTTVDEFMNISKVVSPLFLEMLAPDKHYIEELDGQSIFSLKVPEWKVDPKELDILINEGCRMLARLASS